MSISPESDDLHNPDLTSAVWGRRNFNHTFSIVPEVLLIANNDPSFLSMNDVMFSISKKQGTYDVESKKRFLDDKQSFYFILKSSPNGSPRYENPFFIYEDNEKVNAIPMYSSSGALVNWIDYSTSWNPTKDVKYFHRDNYNILLVKSKQETEDNLKIQICNVSNRQIVKPLTNENIVFVIGKNFTLNDVDYTSETVGLKVFYDLSQISLYTTEFVNIVYFEKK